VECIPRDPQHLETPEGLMAKYHALQVAKDA
jgi:hypothetical protein